MTRQTFTVTEIYIADLGALDLLAEAEEITGGQAYRITIYDHKGMNPEAATAEALFCPEDARLGIAWGADATWADVESIETGIEMWLNGPSEWDLEFLALEGK